MKKTRVYFFGFMITALLLAASIALQIFEGVMPCPLCTLQRLTFGLLGILFLIGILVNRSRIGTQMINMLAFLTSGLGVVLAGRQVWLQYYPAEGNTECGVSLQYMMEVLPVNEVVQKILSGSAECTQRGFEFLGLSMAEWSLGWFIVFLMMSLYLIFSNAKNR